MSEIDVQAALAVAALQNSCSKVPGEPHCAELDVLVAAGWRLIFKIDDDGAHVFGFHLKATPPKETR